MVRGRPEDKVLDPTAVSVSRNCKNAVLSVERTTQPERATLSLDYIAGLITGEGSFILGVWKKREDTLRITPMFRLFMNDHSTVNSVAASLELHGLPARTYMRKQGDLGVWADGAKRVKPYTETFAPRLTGYKRLAALTVDEFITSRLSHPSSNTRYTDAELQLVRELRAINGNRKGRKSPLTYSRVDPRRLRE